MDVEIQLLLEYLGFVASKFQYTFLGIVFFTLPGSLMYMKWVSCQWNIFDWVWENKIYFKKRSWYKRGGKFTNVFWPLIGEAWIIGKGEIGGRELSIEVNIEVGRNRESAFTVADLGWFRHNQRIFRTSNLGTQIHRRLKK